MGSSVQRAPGREHFPSYPRGFIVLRVLQLIVTIIVLGITAYTMAVIAFVSNTVMIFTCVASLIVTVWLVTAHSCAPQAYNYWAVLVLDIFLFLFWLVSFVMMALSTAWLFVSDGSYCSYYSCYSTGLTDAELAFASVLAAASGLGAINCLFFFISLIIHSVVVCRHRRHGLHSKISHGRGAANAPFPLTPQPHSTYTAVPQQGMPGPFTSHLQQDTAYNPHQQMYGAPHPHQQYQQQQQQHPHQHQHQPQQVGYQPPTSPSSPPPPLVANGFYQAPGGGQNFYGVPQQPMSPQHTGGVDPYAKGAETTTAVYEVPGQQVYPANPNQPPAYYPANQNQ